jgi:hypothetical protein
MQNGFTDGMIGRTCRRLFGPEFGINRGLRPRGMVNYTASAFPLHGSAEFPRNNLHPETHPRLARGMDAVGEWSDSRGWRDRGLLADIFRTAAF